MANFRHFFIWISARFTLPWIFTSTRHVDWGTLKAMGSLQRLSCNWELSFSWGINWLKGLKTGWTVVACHSEIFTVKWLRNNDKKKPKNDQCWTFKSATKTSNVTIMLDKNYPWVSKFIWEKQESDLRCGTVMASKTVQNYFKFLNSIFI